MSVFRDCILFSSCFSLVFFQVTVLFCHHAMSCDNPLLAVFAANFVDDLRPMIVGPFLDHVDYYEAFKHDRKFVLLPCGKCVSCKLANARDWSRRLSDELSLLPVTQRSSFVTLTYNDDHLPDGNNLCRADVQNFLKRLRLKVKDKLRYFGCGEYGRKSRRAHYHMITIGWTPNDLYFWKFSDKGFPIYRSPLLDETWSLYDFRAKSYNPIGYVTVGDVVPSSIDYVCRYNLKKVQMDLSDKEVMPFTMCSTRPAIGFTWLKRYYHDCFKLDENGELISAYAPRYYRKKVVGLSSDIADALEVNRELFYRSGALSPEDYIGKLKAHVIGSERFFGKNM